MLYCVTCTSPLCTTRWHTHTPCTVTCTVLRIGTHTQAINMDPGCAGVWAAAVNCATRLEADAAAFNAANRWRKRGTHCMPVKYSMSTKGYEQGIIVRL